MTTEPILIDHAYEHLNVRIVGTSWDIRFDGGIASCTPIPGCVAGIPILTINTTLTFQPWRDLGTQVTVSGSTPAGTLVDISTPIVSIAHF
jgi:hypothetical protein